MSATKRVLYSVNSEVASRFNATFKGRDRSRVIERFMVQAIDEREAEVVVGGETLWRPIRHSRNITRFRIGPTRKRSTFSRDPER